MGVFEVGHSYTPGMHWQQQEQYIGGAYDPSRDLSPTLPPSTCCPDSKSMGDASGASAVADHPTSGGTSTGGSSSCCSTPNNNNHQACASEMCRQAPPPSDGYVGGGATSLQRPPTPHSSFEHHIPKLESPPTPPPQALDDRPGAAHCAGCGLRIADRFYLQAVDRRWHTACLQCCQCRRTLDGDLTCFSRDGNIYCKKDYYRLFGMKRCARCQATILSSELVMRAKHLVFHVHCFSCEACNALLTKGDQFGMRDGSVLCRLHFEIPPVVAAAFPPGVPVGAVPSPHHPHYIPPPYAAAPHGHPGPTVPPPEAVAKVPPFFNGAPTTPRQKGRPRKRKPKDLEDLTSDYLDMQFGRSPGGGSTTGLHGSGGQRTKRMRTSFKHHQLRTMKSYFAINHNPDAKDLKQLSQKTGLPKRVLQVWFQNARAKWRRMMLKQEGKSGEKCSGSESMSDMDLYPHGPGSMGSTISMNPHSPFMMPQGSPSSMDCS